MASPYRQFFRCLTTSSCLCRKPNITKPLVPGTERRILDAITVPVLPPDSRPLPQRCYDEKQAFLQSRKSELVIAYEEFRLDLARKMFTENAMVVICHKVPMPSRDVFNFKAKIFKAGMKLMYVRNDLAREVTKDTHLKNLEPYFVSKNAYIVSETNKLPEMVNILKKTPELQLIGALVENHILSKEEIMKVIKLPPLDVLRGELLSILSASASRTSGLLTRHQQELSANLSQLVKQGEEASQEKMNVRGQGDNLDDKSQGSS